MTQQETKTMILAQLDMTTHSKKHKDRLSFSFPVSLAFGTWASSWVTESLAILTRSDIRVAYCLPRVASNVDLIINPSWFTTTTPCTFFLEDRRRMVSSTSDYECHSIHRGKKGNVDIIFSMLSLELGKCLFIFWNESNKRGVCGYHDGVYVLLMMRKEK